MKYGKYCNFLIKLYKILDEQRWGSLLDNHQKEMRSKV